jgi:hypothetical protein
MSPPDPGNDARPKIFARYALASRPQNGLSRGKDSPK